MADIQTTSWSPTDASNNATPPNGWPEGMNAAQVNDSARANMGALKRWYQRFNPVITSGGAANVQTLTYAVAPASLIAGDRYCFIAGFTNSAAATLNVNALGATTIHTAGGNALVGGEITAGFAVEVFYDGTYFIILSASASTRPTVQTFITGSGTYNRPVGCVRIEVKFCAGGGGGGGNVISGAGGTGATSSFNSITAIGGAGGKETVIGSGGIGGTGGSGSATYRAAGNGGSGGSQVQNGYGGSGGGSAFFGGGAASGGASGIAGIANTGGGASGATGTSNAIGAGGGGGGESVELDINGPASSYSYVVGAGGTSGGTGGAAGGSGYIVVKEFYS